MADTLWIISRGQGEAIKAFSDDLPTKHSNMIAPSDHQSHSLPYPC